MRPLAPLLVALLLAGCFGAEAEPPADDASAQPEGPGDAVAAPATGALLVRARMPDRTLLPGAEITVGNDTRTTDARGEARFEGLAPGEHAVEARKEAHRTAQLVATVVAGSTVEVDAELAALEGDQHAHENGVFAHRDAYVFQGHFDCSATYVIITGDCLLLVDNVTTTAGLPDRPGDSTDERYLIDFALDATWSHLVVEMTWKANASTPATGEGMTLALEPAEAPADGHAAKYARASGGAPLRIELRPGVPHETATVGDQPNPDGGEVIRARAYVMGAGHKPGGTDYLGVGAAVEHDFTLYVSIFYGGEAPSGYTAIPV
ncbi:MAG TPA: carboxypeptidase-like regulatory domain-containing protein [Candidatus Thermoplasmatota archaeon]|nr:carboxypeptidase-like regulatory domain-containing protein [Candidatus Thermoplasmatota archaeon]